MLACLHVPLFPLAARLRAEPDLRTGTVAVTEGNGTAARVVAATRAARRLGLRPGMTLAQARTLLPKLVARGRDAAAERAAQEALLDVAGLFSPRVEDTADGVVVLDVDGLERQFATESGRPAPRPGASPNPSASGHSSDSRLARGDTDWRALGRALLAAAEKEGLPARVGFANGKLAARLAATLADTPAVVPSGGEAAFLAPLPLARLSPEAEVLTTLHRWGLATIGQLAALPVSDVGSRLGEAGHALHQIARGVDPEPLVPRLPPPEFREGLRLDWPLTTLEPFLVLAMGALERLVRRLETCAVGCAALELLLELDPEGSDARRIDLPAPTRDVHTLLTLVRLNLEARPPGAAVVGFTLTAQADRPRRGQLALFGAPEISPDRLATTLAKLFSLLGDGRAGSPALVDSHLPDRAALIPFTPPGSHLSRHGGTRNGASRSSRLDRRPGPFGLLTVRALRPPVPVEVLVDDDRPASVRVPHESSSDTPGAGSDARRERHLAGSVRVASGPWEMEDGWWGASPATRAYWDVELASGGLFRLYRDQRTGSWFVDGVYD